MPSYLWLINWTDRGIQNLKGGQDRIAAGRREIEAEGGRVTFAYLTMGEYDLAVLTEFPDDETAARVLLQQTSRGNACATTLKAFTEEEFGRIAEAL